MRHAPTEAPMSSTGPFRAASRAAGAGGRAATARVPWARRRPPECSRCRPEQVLGRGCAAARRAGAQFERAGAVGHAGAILAVRTTSPQPCATMTQQPWNAQGVCRLGAEPAILVCALAVAALLVAERRSRSAASGSPSPSRRRFHRPRPCFRRARFRLWPSGPARARAVPARRRAADPQIRIAIFRAGLFAFLAGHLAFAAAFLTQPLDCAWLALAAVALSLALLSLWRWLQPALPADMRRRYRLTSRDRSHGGTCLRGDRRRWPGVVARGRARVRGIGRCRRADRFVRPVS